jgi:hypothetical protein
MPANAAIGNEWASALGEASTRSLGVENAGLPADGATGVTVFVCSGVVAHAASASTPANARKRP